MLLFLKRTQHDILLANKFFAYSPPEQRCIAATFRSDGQFTQRKALRLCCSILGKIILQLSLGENRSAFGFLRPHFRKKGVNHFGFDVNLFHFRNRTIHRPFHLGELLGWVKLIAVSGAFEVKPTQGGHWEVQDHSRESSA